MVLTAALFDTFCNENWKMYDGGWVLEDNDPMNDLVSSFEATHGCCYRIYQKPLT